MARGGSGDAHFYEQIGWCIGIYIGIYIYILVLMTYIPFLISKKGEKFKVD
jgi:hypothetical protein